jgi:hypothetical protein
MKEFIRVLDFAFAWFAGMLGWVWENWIGMLVSGMALLLVIAVGTFCHGEINAEGVRAGTITAIEKNGNGEYWEFEIISDKNGNTRYHYTIRDAGLAKDLKSLVGSDKTVTIKYKGYQAIGIEKESQP